MFGFVRARKLSFLIIATTIALTAGLIGVVGTIGPRNVWGMLRYDRRREGSLRVGDKAPDGILMQLATGKSISLTEMIGGRPLVLIFGSYT